MSFLATFVLVFVLIFRPQEIWPYLEAFRLLDVCTALAAIGIGIEYLTGKQRSAFSPQLPFLAAFLACSYVASVLNLGREGISLATTRSLIAAASMLVVMYGARSFTRLRTLMGLLVLLAVFCAGVAIHQSTIEPVCIEIAPGGPETIETDPGTADGRDCLTAMDCSQGGRTDVEYVCERIGLFKTVSVMRRVRWRGQLGDPNELSVYLGMVIPLLFALNAEIRKKWATLLTLAMVAVSLYAIILTKSRGGVLVVGAVFGVYFVSRFGLKKGVLAAAVLALPVVFLGGRAGADADSSTGERLELLYDAMTAITRHPIFGIGIDQFVEFRRQTAHNAYLLAAAELGLPGMFAWTGLLWVSVKIPLTLVRSPPEGLDPDLSRLAWALVVSWLGMAVGIFFLSFTYKQLLFVWLGMSGALYGAVRQADPSFSVRVGRRDYLGIAAFDVAVLMLLFVYTRLRLT